MESAGTGVNITEIIENPTTKIDPVLKNILGNIALYIGIVDILKDLELVPDVIMGYALGELGCAYHDGSLTLEQTVLVAYEIGSHIKSVNEASSTYIINLAEAQVSSARCVSISYVSHFFSE